jgi:Mn2+/Fe2+ NRAMP family transporter
MVIGLILNFVGLNPIKALIYAAVLNGIVAPIIIILIILIAKNEHIMGEWKNGRITSYIGWFLFVLMTASGLAAIYALIP